jgi:hypothetical protein
MWGAGVGILFRLLFQTLVNAKTEVWTKERRTCLTSLTTVYSGLFGLSLVNALKGLKIQKGFFEQIQNSLKTQKHLKNN